MPSPSALYRMADQIADGELAAILTRLKAEGLSYSAIGRRLYADHGIEVSPPTVGAWLRANEPDGDAGEAA